MSHPISAVYFLILNCRFSRFSCSSNQMATFRACIIGPHQSTKVKIIPIRIEIVLLCHALIFIVRSCVVIIPLFKVRGGLGS